VVCRSASGRTVAVPVRFGSMSDRGWGQADPPPEPPPVAPPAWYTSGSVAPPPPGAPFVPKAPPKTRKPKKILASLGFGVVVIAAALYLASTGLGSKDEGPPPRHDADSARLADGEGGPVVGDHWHSAFGIFLCSGYAANLPDALVPEPFGIHSHADGLIHEHPFTEGSAGSNATFGLFLETIGVTLEEGELTMPDGGTFTDSCEGEDASLVVAVWPTADASEPELFRKDFDDLRFLQPDEVWAIALVPKGGQLDKPPSIAVLPNPTDLDETPTPPG
jgi:hypothetical protein